MCVTLVLTCMYYIGAPTILRADRGTENTNIAFLQPFLRDDGEDSFAKEKSFMYGRSTSNQVSFNSCKFNLNLLQRIELF